MTPLPLGAPVPAVPDGAWLRTQRDRLLALPGRAVHPAGGFAWLDAGSRPETGRPRATFVTCRMTHCAALGVLLGSDVLPGSGLAGLVDHGFAALRGVLHDGRHGGWVTGTGPGEDDKQAYTHAFVVLAAASGTAAGRPGARALLDEALEVLEHRFWDERAGRVVDRWDRGWSGLDPYRGANANMHTVEALLAAGDVTGDSVWHERALRITEHLVHRSARAAGWRLPEHYDDAWAPLPEHGADAPADPFRPYGTTPGHLLEWSRLCLHLRATLGAAAPGWLLEAAEGLFDAGVRDGWSVDGEEGFVYTTDPGSRPVVRLRLHWVLAEGISAAAALHRATGAARPAELYATWWDYARRRVVDPVDGSWVHELDEQNRPSGQLWPGRPDVYHALHAALLPCLPLAPSAASALAAGLPG